MVSPSLDLHGNFGAVMYVTRNADRKDYDDEVMECPSMANNEVPHEHRSPAVEKQYCGTPCGIRKARGRQAIAYHLTQVFLTSPLPDRVVVVLCVYTVGFAVWYGKLESVGN